MTQLPDQTTTSPATRVDRMTGAESLAEDLLGDQPEWRENALCAETDPEAFFPEKGGSVVFAKRICRRCGVRPECLEDAMSRDERFGVWGGLSDRERRRLKKKQPSPVEGPAAAPPA